MQVLSEAQAIKAKAIKVPSSDISDEVIIKRIKEGDIDAYGSIMRRYNQRLFRIARSFVSDDAAAMDIVQEAHIKAYTKLDNFNGPTGFPVWLATITRNEALMHLRKHKKEVSMQDDEMEYFQHNESENDSFNITNDLPDDLVENKQLQRLLNKNIDKLPEKFRVVFVLRAIEQFSVKETADILGMKEETVKTRFFRAKRLLRDQIQVYLDRVGMKVYEFGGDHCDVIVHNVMEHLHKPNSTKY